MKNKNELAQFKDRTFMKSRIPALDALATFIPEGEKPNEIVQKTIDKTGFSRWFPVTGGHKVILPYEGGEYDSKYFKVERKAWDHEHCKACSEDIQPMTLCWVTESGPYVLLCEACYKKIQEI